jgi:hypothetical protein
VAIAPELQRGIEDFNARRFFEAHEVWEEAWLRAPEPQKTFLQGIIQVAAAFHHYARGNPEGAESLLGHGLRKLEGFPPDYGGMDVEGLRATARRWQEALRRGESPGEEQLPRIRPAG